VEIKLTVVRLHRVVVARRIKPTGEFRLFVKPVPALPEPPSQSGKKTDADTLEGRNRHGIAASRGEEGGATVGAVAPNATTEARVAGSSGQMLPHFGAKKQDTQKRISWAR
jgi:hypothetical protein